jgi:hypothetical protein
VEARSAATWQATKLWDELKERGDEPAPRLRRILERVIPEVETVLDQGDTMPANFTLHDSGHSWRVARWMGRLAGDLLPRLSSHDLGMLLLSAYLHDIGMTPPLGRVRAHHAHLLSGAGENLSAEEADALQAWLDDNWDGLVPPLRDGTPTGSDLRLADRIVAGYVRHRHNDWSEAWIREHLASAASEMYPAWLDDLVRLCKSHHFSIDELKDKKFNPREVGAPPTLLHLRYCACLLRVADVLDFDPERTPPILFAHRDVDASSAIFWHKDHDLAFSLDGGHLRLRAEPPDALTHHAIKITVDDVDRELAGCRRLADEPTFLRMANREEELPHRWSLDSSVKAEIEPLDDAYEYIDGTFRPDAQRLLELVGGIELYGSSLTAVRELLQNGFDAVREQIARQRLLQDDPSDGEAGAKIADTHKVSLVLQRTDDGIRIVCRDTGTGMSRDIIASRFLVGGTPTDHAIRSLERACQEHGFSVGRTARFGIGVLSYFLLASDLTLSTRRSLEAGGSGEPAWTFTISGLTDFGELKPAGNRPVGTEVALTVRHDLLADGADEFAKELAGYVAEQVRRVPCRFSFEADDFGLPGWSAARGWVDRREAAEIAMVSSFYERSGPGSEKTYELMALPVREAREREQAHLAELRQEAEANLTIAVREGDLPEGLGTYRIHRGHFDLPAGVSLTYMDLEPVGDGKFRVAPIGDSDAVGPGGEWSVMSWNGMETEVDIDSLQMNFGPYLTRIYNTYIEIDWTDDAAGRIAVHRNSFVPSDAAEEATEWVLAEARDFLLELIGEHAGAPTALPNASTLEEIPESLTNASWFAPLQEDGRARLLEPLRFPVVDDLKWLESSGWRWRGSEVTAAPLFEVRGHHRATSHSWHGQDLGPSSVGAVEDSGRIVPVLVWETLQPGQNSTGVPLTTADFPPEWTDLVGVSHVPEYGERGVLAWNAAHPLFASLDRAGWDWAVEHLDEPYPDALAVRDELLAAPARVAAWILLCLQRHAPEIWEGLPDRAETFLPEAWSRVGGLGDRRVVFLEIERGRPSLHILDPQAWDFFSGPDAFTMFVEMFGPPGKSWRLDR